MKTAEELKESQRSPLTAEAAGLPGPSVKNLVERLMLWMPGLSDVEARYAIMDCAREFCSKTNCWTADARWPFDFDYAGDFSFTAGYPQIPNGATALRVREARCGTNVWRGLPPFVFPSGLPGPAPRFAFHGIPPLVASLRMRAAALGEEIPFFTVRLALAPAIGSEDMPGEIVAKWGEAFLLGARANLSLMTGKAWSDPQAAAIYGSRYNAAVGEARTAFEIGNVPSHLQTRSKIPFVI